MMNYYDFTFRHTRFSSTRTSSFDEKLKMVSSFDAVRHVCVQEGSVDFVLFARHRIDSPLDEKRPQTLKDSPNGIWGRRTNF